MTVLAALTWIATAAPLGLKAALNWLKEEYPDTAAAVDKILFDIAEGLAPANIAAAIIALPTETMNALQGRFDPRSHPSDRA